MVRGHQTPLSFCSVEGESGDETTQTTEHSFVTIYSAAHCPCSDSGVPKESSRYPSCIPSLALVMSYRPHACLRTKLAREGPVPRLQHASVALLHTSL